MLNNAVLSNSLLRKAIVLLVTIVATAVLTLPAYAADAVAGKAVFSANCAACHAGGRNAVNPAKTLKKEALEKYEMATAKAIIAQVTKGKNAMPAFGSKLKPEQIENVAAYILAQADSGWAK